MNIFSAAEDIISTTSIEKKIALTYSTASKFDRGEFLFQTDKNPVIVDPGRPEKPILVASRHVARRGLGTEAGRAAMVHALAHIEFNAINLAWDAVYRFRNLQIEYYSDWVKIATQEANHFCLLREHLLGLGYDYGSFPAHDGLWDMAKRTSQDVLIRMAIIHRGFEARGLDVTQPLIKKLKNHDQNALIEILEIIYHDEIEHVAAGTKWFNYQCDQRGLDRLLTFKNAVLQVHPALFNVIIDESARKKAGFSIAELQLIKHGV